MSKLPLTHKYIWRLQDGEATLADRDALDVDGSNSILAIAVNDREARKLGRLYDAGELQPETVWHGGRNVVALQAPQKRGRGRPRHEAAAAVRPVAVRLTVEAYDRLAAAAEAQQTTMSELLRGAWERDQGER